MKSLTLPKLACIVALGFCAIPAVASAGDRWDRGARYDRGYRSHGHYNGYHRSHSSFDVAIGYSSGGYYGGDGVYGAFGYRYGSPGYSIGIGAAFPIYRSTRYYAYEPYCAPPVVYRPAPVYYAPPVYYPRTYYYDSGPCYAPSYYRHGDVGGTYVSSRFYYRR
jgi:hypothetical protein